MLLDEAAVMKLAEGQVCQPLYVVMMSSKDGDAIVRNRVPENIKEQAERMLTWMRSDVQR